jgi:hypothetical protein
MADTGGNYCHVSVSALAKARKHTMSDEHRPSWLEEFEDLANQVLPSGSSCHQVHPIVADWYRALFDKAPPTSRDSVAQAMSCLSTEILNDVPSNVQEVFDMATLESTTMLEWIRGVLMIGRAFQLALDSGELDDL